MLVVYNQFGNLEIKEKRFGKELTGKAFFYFKILPLEDNTLYVLDLSDEIVFISQSSNAL